MSADIKELFDTTIKAPIPISGIDLSEDKKADVLITIMHIIRDNINFWNDRTYKITSWSIGVQLAISGYWVLHGGLIDLSISYMLVVAILLYGCFRIFHL